MASARRRANHRYIGVRIRGGCYYGGPLPSITKAERAKQSKIVDPRGKRHFVLPLMIRSDGRWSYRHGKLARQLKRARR